MRSRLTVPLSISVGLVVAACAGSSDGGTADSPSTVGAETPVVAEPSITEPVTSDPVSTDAPADEPVNTESATTDAPAPVTTPEGPAPSYDFSAIGPIVDEYVTEQGLNGAGLIIVEREGGVVHEEYWGEFDADRISLIASSSKMISASVLMRLDDDGVLDVDAPIADVVEWGAENPAVTPAQLISNSSGLLGLMDGLEYESYLCQYIPDGTLQDCAEQIFTTPDDDADVIQPDSEFRYGGAQWTVAGAVAEAASGRTWVQLVDELIATPCGLESLGYNNRLGFEYPVEFNSDPSTLSPTDNPNPEGGAYVTAPDYAQLMLMQLRSGMCGDEQILSSAAVERMHADRIAEVYDGDAGDPAFGYGMGWWVERNTGRISDAGAFGAVPWLDLDEGFGAYLVIEANGRVGGGLAELLFDPVEAAVLAAR